MTNNRAPVFVRSPAQFDVEVVLNVDAIVWLVWQRPTNHATLFAIGIGMLRGTASAEWVATASRRLTQVDCENADDLTWFNFRQVVAFKGGRFVTLGGEHGVHEEALPHEMAAGIVAYLARQAATECE